MGCEHSYPIMVVTAEDGGRRALCLGCKALGPGRANAQEAREALLTSSRGFYETRAPQEALRP